MWADAAPPPPPGRGGFSVLFGAAGDADARRCTVSGAEWSVERVPCKAHGRILSDGVERGSSQEREQMQMPMQMQMPTRERGFRCVCARACCGTERCCPLGVVWLAVAPVHRVRASLTGLWLSNVCRLVVSGVICESVDGACARHHACGTRCGRDDRRVREGACVSRETFLTLFFSESQNLPHDGQ